MQPMKLTGRNAKVASSLPDQATRVEPVTYWNEANLIHRWDHLAVAVLADAILQAKNARQFRLRRQARQFLHTEGAEWALVLVACPRSATRKMLADLEEEDPTGYLGDLIAEETNAILGIYVARVGDFFAKGGQQ